MPTTITIILVIVLALVLAIPLRNVIKRYLDYARLRKTVHETKDRYAFLIDKNFNVRETNFYVFHPEMAEDGQPKVLGNVLHCRTGCDSGLCGTGIACPTCPVRMVLKNSFQQRRDFTNIIATMHLYDEHHQVRDVDVTIDGKLVSVNYHPMFLVNVSQCPPEEKKKEYDWL